MSDMPWVRFYPSDWLAGTRGLSMAEAGCYITLVAMMYERGEPLPFDQAHLARLCGTTGRSFAAAVERLIGRGHLIETDDGLWNERVAKELSKSINRSALASRSAKSLWEKKRKENNGEPEASASETQCAADANQKPEPEKITPIPLRGLVPQPAGKGSFIAPDWHPSAETMVWATIQLGSTERALIELAKFRDYWAAASGQAARKRDWDAAFRTWCSKAVEFGSRAPPGGGRPPPRRDPFAAMHDRLLDPQHADQQPFDLDAAGPTAALFRPRLVDLGGDR